MTTFIKAKLKKSDDPTNIDKYRVAANISEYHIISNLILQRTIFPKFMMIKQLFCPGQKLIINIVTYSLVGAFK